jgi:hypothetical protein
MIKEWLIKRLIKNQLVFIKNTENKEYYLINNIVFDDGDIEVIIFESKPVEKTNSIKD